MTVAQGFVPVLRDDLIQRRMGDEVVAWSPMRGEPTVLDPVASVMATVVDGRATVAELADDVADVVGLAREVATAQVERCISQMDRAGMLTTSSPAPASRKAIFVSPISSCIETASCTGRVTPVSVEIAGQAVRVACGTGRVARRLRSSLGLPTAPADAPLGFVVKAARRGLAGYQLVDRGGLTLGAAKSTSEAVAMVASHLGAWLPPAPGRVRFRVRALVRGDHVLLCTFPLLFAPAPDEALLDALGWRLLDRLAVDVDVVTGTAFADAASWEDRVGRSAARGHIGGLANGAQIAGVLVAQPGGAPVKPSPAQVAVTLAAEALSGERADVLAVAEELATGSPVDHVRLDGRTGLESALRRVETS